MRPVSALSTSIGTLRRHPAIVGVLFGFSLVSTLLSATQIVSPLLGSLSVGLVYLGLPFVMAGLLAYIADALDGTPSFDTFLAAGKRHYVGLLVGGLIVVVATFIVYLVVGLLFVVGAVTVFSAGAGSFGPVTLAALAVLGLLAFLLVMIPLFLTQFYPAGVVIDGDGIADGFRRSLRLVRSEFRSILGFDLLTFAVSLIAQIPVAYLLYRAFDSMLGMAPAEMETFTIFDALSTTEIGLFFGLQLLTSTVVGSVLYTYYVAYYDELRSFTDEQSTPDTATA
jgi:hypothetical protein